MKKETANFNIYFLKLTPKSVLWFDIKNIQTDTHTHYIELTDWRKRQSQISSNPNRRI